MPVLIDRGSNPWRPPSPGTIEVGLLNNMPDAALEATERQFAALLQPAAENVTVRLRLFSLPGIARGERAQRHLDTRYAELEATERQFAALLQPAAENVTVRLRLFSLPGIARGERAQRHLDTRYA